MMAKYLDEDKYRITGLDITSIPSLIRSKSSASPVTSDWDKVTPKDKNIKASANGTLKIKVMPDTGISFADLMKTSITLLSDSGYIVTYLDYDSTDDSVELTLVSEWTNSTGKKMKVQAPKLKAGRKKMTVSWKKDGSASGYQIRYSYKSNMSGAKVKNVNSKSKKSCVIKKLKKGRKVYVQMRSFVKYGGRTYYGWLGPVKKVKIK